MRVVKILIGGGMATAVAFSVAQSEEGTIGAVAVILVMFCVVTTIGLLAAAFIDQWARRAERRRHRSADVTQCSGCGGARHSAGDLWICAHCDQTAAV